MNVVVEERPIKEWQWAPPISECKFKIIISSCVHFYIAVVLLVCGLSLLNQAAHDATKTRIPELTIVKLTIGVVAILIFILFILYCLPKYMRLYNQMRCYNNPVVNVLPCKKRVKRKRSNVSFFKLINSNRVSNESSTRGYHGNQVESAGRMTTPTPFVL